MVAKLKAKFTGGKKLEKKLKEIGERVENGTFVKVGFLEDATYPDGTNVAQVAFWLNFGTKFMPPRPFFNQFIAENKGEWGKKLARVLEAANYDTTLALARMGYGMKGQLQDKIIAFNNPPDSDETLARKKSAFGKDATLVDTGHMLNSVDFDVSDDPQ
jgi:hypothetical protein